MPKKIYFSTLKWLLFSFYLKCCMAKNSYVFECSDKLAPMRTVEQRPCLVPEIQNYTVSPHHRGLGNTTLLEAASWPNLFNRGIQLTYCSMMWRYVKNKSLKQLVVRSCKSRGGMGQAEAKTQAERIHIKQRMAVRPLTTPLESCVTKFSI